MPVPALTPPSSAGAPRYPWYPDTKADMTKVTYHRFNCKGHYTNTRKSKTGVHYHPGKSPSELETGLSHSTTDIPTNVPSVLPDFPTQELEDNVGPPSGANYSPERAKLFVPDKGYSGNTLHCVIVKDVHTVQKLSQAKAECEIPSSFGQTLCPPAIRQCFRQRAQLFHQHFKPEGSKHCYPK
ncbi:hypothetical protein DSO57_1004718 [Entomophthora muscae]|uniref:Uncharacterized protein n=1 Tax=Entomophthora muscae TaxID=34485 RepID=A0ACC2SXJ2_9FUNG|nr:hypothetical protein DSO57_1004718 [Entomophthora muscae]